MSESQPNLGELPGGGARRDAVHIALIPLAAGQQLHPGQSVRVMDGKAWGSTRDSRQGIVDPFLEEPVPMGTMVWVLLNPNSVVGLRHVWRHPEIDEELSGRPMIGGHVRLERPAPEYERPDQKAAFDRALAADPYDVATRNAYADWLYEQGDDAGGNEILAWSPELQASLNWLDDFAEKVELSRAGLMRAAEMWLETGDPYVLPFDTPSAAYREAETFWEHYAHVTGLEVADEKRRSFFTCSC